MTEPGTGPPADSSDSLESSRRPPMVRHTTAPVRVLDSGPGGAFDRPDRLATEEPMAVQARGPDQEPVSVSVTMRTPGNDFELAVGFLFTEGLVGDPSDVAAVRYCDVTPGEQHYNVVTVDLHVPFARDFGARNFYASSSCGICGKASLDHVEVACAPLAPGPVIARSTILALPGSLHAAQRLFEQTGGLHAAGLFSPDGALVAVREDVGRHNAVDKLVGRALLAGELPLRQTVLMVSGRVSFEIVQKAAAAGIPVLCAVSAPSSLAVEAANRLNMTVVGFLRGESFNVYCHPERIDVSA